MLIYCVIVDCIMTFISASLVYMYMSTPSRVCNIYALSIYTKKRKKCLYEFAFYQKLYLQFMTSARARSGGGTHINVESTRAGEGERARTITHWNWISPREKLRRARVCHMCQAVLTLRMGEPKRAFKEQILSRVVRVPFKAEMRETHDSIYTIHIHFV